MSAGDYTACKEWRDRLILKRNKSSLTLSTGSKEVSARVGWKIHICYWWFFWPMGCKHCNTNESSVLVARETMLKKYTSFGCIPWDYLVQPINFSATPYMWIIIIVMPSARISLTLSRHPSLSFIASGRSSGLHPISTQSCCM